MTRLHTISQLTSQEGTFNIVLEGYGITGQIISRDSKLFWDNNTPITDEELYLVEEEEEKANFSYVKVA